MYRTKGLGQMGAICFENWPEPQTNQNPGHQGSCNTAFGYTHSSPRGGYSLQHFLQLLGPLKGWIPAASNIRYPTTGAKPEDFGKPITSNPKLFLTGSWIWILSTNPCPEVCVAFRYAACGICVAAVLPDAGDDKVTNHMKIDIQMAIDAAVKGSP